MGVGPLELGQLSEDSSSSMAFTMSLGASGGADENSNDTNLNKDLPKMCHQRSSSICRSIENSGDNAIDNGNKLFDPCEILKSTMGVDGTTQSDNSIRIYAEQTQRFQPASGCTFNFQQKQSVGSNASLESGFTSIGKTTGRSPLATVICNSASRNSITTSYNQEQHLQILNAAVANSTFENATPQNQPPLSPCLPSTSQAAYKKQQQLYHMQLQKQHQHHQQMQQQQQASDCLFLSRHPAKQTTGGIDYFGSLSDEMVLQIFKWLPKKALLRCGSVCRRFNRCASDETLWTRLDLGGRSLRPGAMHNVLSRGVVILRLAQSQLNHPVWDSCSNVKSKLQYLDLSLATITKPSLKLLLSSCRQLKKLSLEHVPVNDEICNEIAKNTQLEALNLTMCVGLEAWSVRKMMESLQNLNSLNISWTNLSVDAVTSLVTNITSNLLRLNISGCRKTMFDSHLSTLAKRCPLLLELDLSDCTGLTRNAIGIICTFKMLEYVSLSRCYQIPATSYIDLANSPSLSYLDLFGMLTDAALELLENSFPRIGINKFIHSSVARPTVGTRRTSIWGLRTRD